MNSIFLETDFGTKKTDDGSIDNSALVKRLKKPHCKIDAVLDTDTYNEIDDQFALSYMVRSENRINIKAIYAAPFHNEKSESPEDGMEKSYNEIMTLLSLLGREDLKSNVFRGSGEYLKNEKEPVHSPAAEHLTKLAMEYTPEKPLYVVAIGAITNVASAILLKPEIIDRIVVVWLGGNAYHWHVNVEFNLTQDIAGARVLFGCGAAVVQLPCMGVVSNFTVSGPELEYHFKGKNRLCDYLVKSVFDEVDTYNPPKTWTRIIWDVTAVAWLMEEPFMSDRLEHSPIPEYGPRYTFDNNRHLIKYVYAIDRDLLMEDLINKLTK